MKIYDTQSDFSGFYIKYKLWACKRIVSFYAPKTCYIVYYRQLLKQIMNRSYSLNSSFFFLEICRALSGASLHIELCTRVLGDASGAFKNR